ncbi:Transmembrane protein [Trema orientale]|uniref:Transmembrane protein n=1 Tax=Trema orientale TaxID=63057 RepID=A0A2P5FK06_TREOI|nr:Transmembrane protein [Trema orientale]
MANDKRGANDMREIIWELRSAMQSGWDAVVKLYMSDPRPHLTTISGSGYTALHVAVADGEEDIVQKLVDAIKSHWYVNNAFKVPRDVINMKEESGGLFFCLPEADEIKDGETVINSPLGIKNSKGNTPLHLAASIGNVRMCKYITDVGYEALLEDCNDAGESPLFLAALHGRKEAFLFLNSLLKTQASENHVNKRNNRDTILHCAVSGDYFDLAFQILQLYPNLATSVNVHGKTPLHILASKPSAFKSACTFGLWKAVIYECIIVEKLQQNSKWDPASLIEDCSGTHPKPETYPANYIPLVRCFGVLWEFVMIGT